MKRALPALLAVALAACGVSSASSETTVVIGYQSKTINTVTAGTLLRSLGLLENRLGRGYRVVWQDYSTGAPITAQMVAGKIDIGSMGDYPMLINGSRNQQFGDGHTKLVAATGYNLRGALNMVVVGPKSPIRELKDLAGKKISASVGSAGHGTTVHALERAGVTGFRIQNQVPAVGASSLQSGSVDALGLFVAWPGQLVFAGQDEPFGALDAQTRTAMQRLLVQVWQQHPTTVVFVTHDVDEALFLGDRVVVLGRDGRLVNVVESPVARIEGADSAAARAEILSGVSA